MNRYRIGEFQRYIDENSHYCKLLKERFINPVHYKKNLASIEQGLSCLGIPQEVIDIFRNRNNFIIWLGRRLDEYEGYELALYIGHKKMGLPIPAGLKERCPKECISIIDQVSNKKFIYELKDELRRASFSPEIFLAIHKSILGARVENLFPVFLADIEKLGFTDINEAIKKIPRVYLDYLSESSFLKLVRKLSSMLKELKGKMLAELKEINLYALRLKEQLEGLYLEANQNLRNIIENDVAKGTDVNIITQKVANLFSRLDRLFLGNVYHLKDYERREKEIQAFLEQEEQLKYAADKRELNRRKKLSEIYEEYMFFNKFGVLTKDEYKNFTRFLSAELEQLHRQKKGELSLLNRFEKRGLLSVELDFDAIEQGYHTFIKQTIVPQYMGQCFLELVSCFPPPANAPRRVVLDQANLYALTLQGKGVLHLKEQHTFPEDIVKYAETYRKCITILIYDIRGSSYMGIKLHDAVKEQRVKYKFAREMAEVVKRYGGFLLKDTGDGGLVWFAENSESMYNHLYTESVTGRGMKLRYSIFSGAEFNLIPAMDSAKRAILCARDMVQRAEEFIRANFIHYREWFADVAERTLELDGITYALLPPEFKSLFRIGVGIASGIPDRDVVFCANSYGDPDLVGPIIADAHLYSMERQPGRSVVICDLPTLVNFVLNIENFEYVVEKEDFEEYLKAVQSILQKEHMYRFSDQKVLMKPKCIHFLEELNKINALVETRPDELLLDKDGNLFTPDKKKVKLIYEILNL